MAAIKYDVSDVEAGGGGEEPQPGTYPGKIVSMTHRKERNDKTKISDLEVVCDIGTKYVRLWTYVKLPDDPAWNKESHGWKLRELTDALGLPPKGAIDPAKVNKEKPAVLVKVTSDSHRDTGEYRGRVKNLFPIGDNEVPSDDTEPDAGGSDEGPYSREDMEGWPDEDIRGYAEELGVDNITGRGWKVKLLDAIEAAQGEATGEAPEPDEPDEPEASGGNSTLLDGVENDAKIEVEKILDGGEEYLADWEDTDLQWLIQALGIEGNLKTTGRGWQAKARTGLVEFAQEALGDAPDGAGDHEATDDEITDDYDDEDDAGNPVWPDQDLKDEINTRNEQGAEIKIAGRWSRAKAIEALREDNRNADAF